MYFLEKNVITKDQFCDARKNVLDNKETLSKVLSYGDNHNKQIIYRIPHTDFSNLKILTNTVISEKIISTLKKKFKKVFLINLFYGTINSYTINAHKDGQSYQFKGKRAYEINQKTFKVIQYFNDYEPHLMLSKLSSKPINFFDNEKIFPLINHYYEKFFKKNFFFKNVDVKNYDALIMDNNTWHKTMKGTKINNQLINKSEDIRKIFISYDVVVDDIEIAKEYSHFLSEKYNFKTNYKKELDFLLNTKLKLFDEVVDLS